MVNFVNRFAFLRQKNEAHLVLSAGNSTIDYSIL